MPLRARTSRVPCRNRVSGTIYGPFRCSVFFSFAFIVVAFLAVPCTWARLSHGVFAGVLARFPPSRAAGAAARARLVEAHAALPGVLLQ